VTENIKDSMESLANEIRSLAQQMRVSVFLSMIYTADVVNRYLDIALIELPASRTGFNILHNLILRGGTMTPTDISKRIFRSRQGVTKTIDTLEKQGLVKREPIGEDRRTRKVSITREGVKLIKKTSSEGRERISRDILQPLNETQIEDLGTSLRQIRKHVLSLISDYQIQQDR